MPIEFSTWQARMAGTILDTSIVDKKSDLMQGLTAAQKRMIIADLLVPNPTRESEVTDWVSAFSVTLDGESGYKVVAELSLAYLIGLERTIAYTDTDTDEDSLRWLSELKADINNGLELNNDL